MDGRVIGRVVNVTDYGAFVELEPGVEGLIHISEMTWSRRMKHPSKVVKPGDQVEAGGARSASQGPPHFARTETARSRIRGPRSSSRYSVGSVVEGRVRNMTDFGAFIEIEEGIDGLVHVSDLSWTKRVKHPSRSPEEGSDRAGGDSDYRFRSATASRWASSSLQPDAWETFFQTHQVGDSVHGRVLRLAGFGAFVELAEGVEGLCHFSEVPGYSGRRTDPPPLTPGDEMEFKIIQMSEAEKKIGLSIKALADAEERTRLDEYRKRAAAASSSFEDYAPGHDPR